MQFLKKLTSFWATTPTTPNAEIVTQTIVNNRIPAAVLLGEQAQLASSQTHYGNIPVPLFPTTILQFELLPTQTLITGIRLRFGTYCRANTCNITVRIQNFVHSFTAKDLIDNEYATIVFPTPFTVNLDKPLTIQVLSPNAGEDNVVALWCTAALPIFQQNFENKPLHLPLHENPRVSIVIPVFNKVLYTYNCLLSLQNCDESVAKEVIIVNNASSDETAAFLDKLTGNFKVIHNENNRGFVEACKQGADIAKGEFILFLNNDTQVTPHWLENLLKIMDNQSDVGIVGSKLIYPNGYLQEAGGIIFSDASGWNYGRMQDPTQPHFNQDREVDYCSGASLMIRTGLWQQLGGFDMRYAPAYYEDTDLCFAARYIGYKVWYCAGSEVIHHEGITAGTDLSTGYKAYQNINKEKFTAKWAEVLKKHPPAGSDPDQAARRFMNYAERTAQEIENYRTVQNVHDLPDIFHYWSNKYLLPKFQRFGFSNAIEFYVMYMRQLCDAFRDETCQFISIGAGNCDIEVVIVKKLLEAGKNNFQLECLDLNPYMLQRGKELAEQQCMAQYLTFTCTDINGWQPTKPYHVIVANQSLHHFVELETLFTKIDANLHPQGYFVTDDMIGRNGHQRWEEALEKVHEFWRELPARYHYNHLLKRVEPLYENWDCSVGSFEGIRAQDILPLLIEKFSFDMFFAYGNIIEVFIDRCFGHNFNPHNPDDLAFIDRVHAADEAAIHAGIVKPTHMTAAMMKKSVMRKMVCYEHLTPEFCVRPVSLPK